MPRVNTFPRELLFLCRMKLCWDGCSWLMPLGTALPGITHGATAPYCQPQVWGPHLNCSPASHGSKWESGHTKSISQRYGSHFPRHGSAPIHSTRNRAAANMQAAPKDKFVARFFSLHPSFFPLENSNCIDFVFPKRLSGQLEFEAVFTSKLPQAALTC